MAQGAPSSSPFTNTFTHDVFLNFRGSETRIGFTGNLYSALSQRGVLTFIDDDLRKGGEITTSLLKAIKETRIAIVIFSKNYAYSTYCLKELVEIHECAKEKGQQIWPIFYDVTPTEVRYQTGTFGEALAEHEKGRFKVDIETVQKWRLALREVADLSGWPFKQQGKEYEHVFIKKIVDMVSLKLKRPFLHVADYPVGLETHVQRVQSLLDAKFDNKVNMLGIYGIGGMGKSTLARYIYNLKASQFESSCFLASVRDKSTGHGLVQIQETMLSQLVGERNIKLGDVNHGIPILKERLCRKKVLLIIDDVNKLEQLKAIAGGPDWFGFGSIIIITTRNKQLLDNHRVDRLYEVNKLGDCEALKLFRWNAFNGNKQDPSYKEVTERAIHYADGLPLALEIIGSNLIGKTVYEWESALEAYESIPSKDIQEILRVSYDDLEVNEKDIFLDIACFFKGCTLRYVTSMLHARGFHAKYGIRVLEKKSLIKILKYHDDDDDVPVTMHDLIQYMGKEIVRQQSTWPDKPSRLWFHKDTTHIWGENKENYVIEAIVLDIPEDKEVHWNPKVFGKMKNLRMLIIKMRKSGSPFGSPKYLPNSLRVLEWWGYPSASLPFDFLPENLIMLNLSHSCFQWNEPLKMSKSLSHLIFTGCEYIRQIPDVSSSPNLTELCVDDCTNLIEIHVSVGLLDKLQRFSAKGCTKLKIVPCGIKLPSLEYLCLRDCSSLDIFPEILGPMEKLQFVDFEGTAIKNLPLSMQNVGALQSLSLNRCKMLNIDSLLNVGQMLPIFFTRLESLGLDCSNWKMMPECIKECRNLKILSVNDCKQLNEIRWLPPNIRIVSALNCPSLSSTSNMLLDRIFYDSTVLRISSLTAERLPEWFDHSCRGNSVSLWFRNGIPDITVGVVIARGTGPFDCFVKINNDLELNCYTVFSNLESEKIQIHNYFCAILSSSPRLHLRHGWNCAEISFLKHKDSDHLGAEPVRSTGVYVNRGISRMENIRFTNPYPPGNGLSETQQFHHVHCNPYSVKSTRTTIEPFILYLWLLLNLIWVLSSTVWPLSFYYNFTRIITRLGRAVFDHPKNAPGESSRYCNRMYCNSDSVELARRTRLRKKPFVLPLWLLLTLAVALGFNMLSLCFRHNSTLAGTNIDPSNLDYLKMAPGESFLAEGFNESVSSSDKVSGELDHNRCCTDESFRNQLEQGQDDAEMEAFYASLDAGTHDKSATTAPSEDAREALKIVRDFISSDASIFLHPEQCSVMKTSLDYLFHLSGDGGLSGEMIALISEASREFTRWSKDYTEASMKIESTASELSRADELDADLENNKKQFRGVVALQNELLQKLAYMEERKKELEEQINAIKADISSSQSENNMVYQRKRDIFEEGKMLKTQRDELRKKEPLLQQEHGLAKETQTRIKDEWSKLGDKYKKIFIE